jgi:hypothetical protein
MTDISVGNSDQDRTAPGFLKSVLGASGLITAWVFVMGWAYLYTYYEYFGVNVNSLGFPVYHYLLFCFAQFVTFRWTGVLIGLLIVAVFLLTWAGTTTVKKTWAVSISVSYLVLFWIGFHFAVVDGASTAVEDMGVNSSLPLISVELKDSNRRFKYGMIEQTLQSQYLRLLLSNEDRLFVFVPVDTTQQVVHVRVVEVDRSDIVATIRGVNIKTK